MTQPLREGDRSPRVAEVRKSLNRLGLLREDSTAASSQQFDSFAAEDTLFDAALFDALCAFQQSRGIICDGQIGEITLRALREASYTLGARALQYQPTNEQVGDDVVQLQKKLQELGFYTDRIDGRYGAHTFEAVRSYQLNYGLETDGICGPKTVKALSRLGLHITGGSPLAIREHERIRRAGPLLTGKRVVIDPGFSCTAGDQPMVVDGVFGPISEEEILWDIAARLEGRMIAAGVETILSRPRGDKASYDARAEIANAFGADLMICLQADRYRNERASGCATFYYGSEMGSCSLTGEKLSGFIQREIVARTNLVNCGNHPRTWDLLRLTHMPTVQVVAGYLTNPDDVAALTDPLVRDDIAEAIVVAVKRLYLVDQDDLPTGTYSFAELLEQELS